jgi:hypothetical protein
LWRTTMTIRLSDIQSGKGGFILVGESKYALRNFFR